MAMLPKKIFLGILIEFQNLQDINHRRLFISIFHNFSHYLVITSHPTLERGSLAYPSKPLIQTL